ncbi:MAG: hypothetical protein V3W43_06660 [Desulfatiglandaceae bacterium]
MLVVSSDYVWEKKGPIEITIKPGKRVYFLLKLFSTRADRPEDDHGGGVVEVLEEEAPGNSTRLLS